VNLVFTLVVRSTVMVDIVFACATRHQFRRVHARTGLAGARRMQVL